LLLLLLLGQEQLQLLQQHRRRFNSPSVAAGDCEPPISS
jgi:hypothetical protein